MRNRCVKRVAEEKEGDMFRMGVFIATPGGGEEEEGEMDRCVRECGTDSACME